MTDISATSFFRLQAAEPIEPAFEPEGDSAHPGLYREAAAVPDFEHEEIDTGGMKRPTKINLHALDPDTGDRMGTLTYHVPARKADKILIEHLGTEDAHRRKGVGSALMDEMQRRHPGTPIDHGDRTDAGKGWWKGYTDGKKVTRGRTIASADAPDGDHHIELHRGLNLGLASAGDIEHLHRDPAGYLAKHHFNSQNAGIHWSANPYIAHNFALAHEEDEDDETPYTHGVVLHARVAPHHVVPHGTDEWQRYADEHEIYGPDHSEDEHTIRSGAPLHITGVTATSRHMYGGEDRETTAPWGHHVTASADTPVPDNAEPYEHEHPWLPRDHFFAPTPKGLDERLFDGDRMRPEVRRHLLGLINSLWAPRYGDSWQTWARVYLAGSEASHFYGNSDLDVLIGIDHDALNQHVDAFCGEPDAVVDERLTDELREHLNDEHRMLPGPDGKETGPWESTWYVNPGSYDIREIKPYAAYDITRDEWAVRPVEVPDDFGPEKLPESTWDVFEALRTLIKAVGELPGGVREREGAALYDYLHGDRHSAFGPDGTGLYDPANAVWKALDKAPGKPLQQLIDWKHAHDGATAQEAAA